MSEPEARILIVDDDDSVQRALERVLEERGYECMGATSARGARAALKDGEYHLVLSDISLPGESGMELTRFITRAYPDTAVLIITGLNDPETAAEALDSGALGYLTKPFDPNTILINVASALRRREVMIQYRAKSELLQSQVQERTAELQEAIKRLEANQEQRRRERTQQAVRDWGTAPNKHTTIAGDDVTKQMLALAQNVARTPSTVLLTGESGAGKEVVARYVHAHSDRADNPFIAVNCAALPATLLESELFGHEKGAFSGAIQRHRGVFERASGGTLLLDEISEIPVEMQAKLLRVLQEQTLIRVGGTKPLTLDIRLIATSNRELKECVRDGTFRLDLFYRLNVFPIRVPPLRHRPRDIGPMADHFLTDIAAKMSQRPKRLRESALACLKRYRFPGNVRELRNILERAIILAHNSATVNAEHILFENALGDPSDTGLVNGKLDNALTILPGEESLQEVERKLILSTLAKYDGNRTRAAEALGISLRTVRNKLKAYRDEGVPIPTG